MCKTHLEDKGAYLALFHLTSALGLIDSLNSLMLIKSLLCETYPVYSVSKLSQDLARLLSSNQFYFLVFITRQMLCPKKTHCRFQSLIQLLKCTFQF